MSVHLQREITSLKKAILALGAVIEEQVREAVRSVVDRDLDLATKVIDTDAEIDRTEVRIEEECLKVLALHQPVAVDLRFLVAVLKINNDLERIGDQAVNIAMRGAMLASKPRRCGPFGIPQMGAKTQIMLKNSLDALVNADVALAHAVRAADDEVDNLNRNTLIEVRDCIRENLDTLECAMRFLEVARNLERVGDLATNIAEDVIYMLEGQIVRHPYSYPNPKFDK
jgi:phosphate transport system protein